jgi:hypothetical protein
VKRAVAEPAAPSGVVDEDARWNEVRAISREVAYKDGAPTRVESAFVWAVHHAIRLVSALSREKAAREAAEQRADEYANRALNCEQSWTKERADRAETTLAAANRRAEEMLEVVKAAGYLKGHKDEWPHDFNRMPAYIKGHMDELFAAISRLSDAPRKVTTDPPISPATPEEG